MMIKKPLNINPSEITPEKLYMTRRDFLNRVSKVGITGGLASTSLAGMLSFNDLNAAISFSDVSKSPYSTDEEKTEYEHATTYNNFYEFGTGKDDPANNSSGFNPLPWSVEIAGLCAKPGTYDLEDFIKPNKLEERIYRLRCVEAWSMVIPWLGVSLGDILKKFEPTSDAKYVAFTTIHRPEEMPGQKRRSLKWPYVEGLRLDEAMHPLSTLAVGMYGKELPNQNGAPLRLVVPWKYGYKSIKSIVKIEFTKSIPPTSWNITAPNEYGFYSNVNPDVNHPRWSQKKERRIGEFLKRETLMFNGYPEVASLYSGMNLRKNF
jgi:sulfoxide reductase catalytic subunit YedY